MKTNILRIKALAKANPFKFWICWKNKTIKWAAYLQIINKTIFINIPCVEILSNTVFGVKGCVAVLKQTKVAEILVEFLV